MIQPFTINLHLPNDMRIAIGDVAAQWSFLEFQIGQIIHELLKLSPKQGRTLTTQMHLRPQLEVIDLLFQVNKTDQNIVDYFKNIDEAISVMHGKRNTVVHGLWASLKGSNEHHIVSYHGKKENRVIGKTVQMKAPGVREIASNIENINLHLGRTLYVLRIGEFPPSVGKLPTLPRKAKPSRQKYPQLKKSRTPQRQH